jgi:hypothetical protein
MHRFDMAMAALHDEELGAESLLNIMCIIGALLKRQPGLTSV